MDVSNLLAMIWHTLLLRWLVISGALLLAGCGMIGIILFRNARHLRQRMKASDPYVNTWQSFKQETTRLPDQAFFRYTGLHLMSIFPIKPSSIRTAIGLFLFLSIGLGLIIGLKMYSSYVGWNGELPYNSITIWLPLVSGLFTSSIPFLLMHSIIQVRRVKLSYQLLPYAEELERQYLDHESIKPALEALVPNTSDPLQDFTYRLIHGLQRGQYVRVLDTLALLEHQIGTKFANVLAVLIREGVGIGSMPEKEVRKGRQMVIHRHGAESGIIYGKDVRMGFRSLVTKMHLQKQVQDKDKPKKREMSQIGLLTFPVLYGAHYFAQRLLTEKAHHYLFEIPSQLNLFIGAVLVGIIAITLNIIFGRRRLDL